MFKKIKLNNHEHKTYLQEHNKTAYHHRTIIFTKSVQKKIPTLQHFVISSIHHINNSITMRTFLQIHSFQYKNCPTVVPGRELLYRRHRRSIYSIEDTTVSLIPLKTLLFHFTNSSFQQFHHYAHILTDTFLPIQELPDSSTRAGTTL